MINNSKIYSRNQHPISRKNISKHALDVLYKLHKEGFRACLVGGGVRDLLLNNFPKDFDIATDAHPEQIKRLFRNCRLIGRRFRLAHIVFGREVIEVATFRAQTVDANASSTQSIAMNETGFLVRDNVYGDIEDDALRRDFTINALYYDIADFSIIDYCDGMRDLKEGIIRLIGDPAIRFREDPVRILRAIRFEAKLNFSIEATTKSAMSEMAYLLQDVSSARMFDEMIKLLLSGVGVKTYHLMNQYQLFGQIFPQTQQALQLEEAKEASPSFIEVGLNNSDTRLEDGLSVSPFFLYAVLLWPAYQIEYKDFLIDGLDPNQAAHKAADLVLQRQQQYVAIPKRFSLPLQETWFLQDRLEKSRRSVKFVQSVLGHPQFRAGLDFLQLRVRHYFSDELQACFDFWKDAYENEAKSGEFDKRSKAKFRIRSRRY